MAGAGNVYRHDYEGVAAISVWDSVAASRPVLQDRVERELTMPDERDRPDAVRSGAYADGTLQEDMEGARTRYPSIASNSPIIPSIMPSPICQNAGSVASSPKGLSSSEWCLVPPAASIAR